MTSATDFLVLLFIFAIIYINIDSYLINFNSHTWLVAIALGGPASQPASRCEGEADTLGPWPLPRVESLGGLIEQLGPQGLTGACQGSLGVCSIDGAELSCGCLGPPLHLPCPWV